MRNTTFGNLLWPCAFALLLYLIGAVACSRPVQSSNNKSYMPALLKGIELGQDQVNVLKLRPALYPVNSLMATTWQQYTEDLDTENLTSVYYNFEKTGSKRLVSIELLHPSVDAATVTFQNFGGVVSADNSRRREQADMPPINAVQKGSRVTFSLVEIMPKNNTNND